ncbi:ATP-binding protein [Pendulispora albinea]|uniref:ATP-binding protein n=1 Tax=Pendulispora albinea TaxID=2741071 RepID=A0ABZ2LK57_9BACT
MIVPAALYVSALGMLAYGAYRSWRLVQTPDPLPVEASAAAIKGPIAFQAQDGKLFRELGRENELLKLFGYVRDNQTRMVILMGASGAGKTSLLHAGLTDILADKSVKYHYWEALPTDPGEGLMRALFEGARSIELGEHDRARGESEPSDGSGRAWEPSILGRSPSQRS